MSAQSNAELARKIYAAFNKHDLETCVANATENIEVVLTPFGQTFRGQAGFKEFLAGFKKAFPDLTVTVTNQVATESQVVNECSWKGSHTGPLISPSGEIPPTRRTVTGAVFCEVWGFKNGKVASIRNYQDVSSWLRQLGLVP